ncbi:hypothetical protein [Streptacidiphilus sp. MAP12-20]|uniref:hypothetical protein n=1 Tax=Streptacidiphilus sp. MAP12-20 TaxID=3156299 RepID=UPI0035118FC2
MGREDTAFFGHPKGLLTHLSLALANGISAQTVKLYGTLSDPVCFALNGGVVVVVALIVMALAPWLPRTMYPVH